MGIEDLQKRISEVAKEKNIEENEIISALISHIDVIYNNDYSSSDKEILKEVKKKVLKTLYDLPNHEKVIIHHTDYNNLFDLDNLELKFLQRGCEELVSEGLLNANKYGLSLTEKGIREVR